MAKWTPLLPARRHQTPKRNLYLSAAVNETGAEVCPFSAKRSEYYTYTKQPQ